MRRGLAWALLCCFCLCVAEARAQGDASALASDDAALNLVRLALGNIASARCGSGPCAPATPEEIASPPISPNEARIVIVRGVISSQAEACELDWQKENFVPMMAYWRNGQNKTDRQLALIALLHGVVLGAMGSKGSCTDQKKQETQARLAFKP